jgi:hypothetical protein
VATSQATLDSLNSTPSEPVSGSVMPVLLPVVQECPSIAKARVLTLATAMKSRYFCCSTTVMTAA